MGSQLDTTRVPTLTADGEIALDAGMAHFEGARGETVIDIRGTGPWGITFIDLGVDPSRAGALVCSPRGELFAPT